MANKKGTIAALAAGAAAAATTIVALRRARRLQAEARAAGKHVPRGPYEAVVKRPLDVALSAAALVALSPVYAATAIAVRAKLGSPVIFKQLRPGIVDPVTGEETLFEMYKFRSMTDERDQQTGELVPDEVRLTPFGKCLRASSLDELPELVNVLKGDMSLVGPRPQLVRDMVFMTSGQRKRHEVRPGLSGLAQVNGRNALEWETKFEYDLAYINDVTFFGDATIVLQTLQKVLFLNGVDSLEVDVADDYGDYLLRLGELDEDCYEERQREAEIIVNRAVEIGLCL